MKEKIENIILTILFILFILFMIFVVYEIKDFYDDYKCSTTTDNDYYIKNKCERYER